MVYMLSFAQWSSNSSRRRRVRHFQEQHHETLRLPHDKLQQMTIMMSGSPNDILCPDKSQLFSSRARRENGDLVAARPRRHGASQDTRSLRRLCSN